MTSEDLIETIVGRFGRYQTWILFLLSIGRLPTDYQLTNVVFVIPSVNYVCMDTDAYNLTNHCPCDNPLYDQSVRSSSVVTTWNLICDRSQLASLTQSMLQIGILTGSLIYGHISDRYGRRLAVLCALFSEVVFAALSAASTSIWIFMLLRLLIGTAVGGTMLCNYVLIIELSGKSFRPYLTALLDMPYVMGYFTLPMIAYFLRDWRYLQIATSLPWLFVTFYYFLIPESPRWLITKGKKDEAIKILTNIARKNGRQTGNIKDIVEQYGGALNSKQKQEGSYMDLFRTPKIRVYSLVIAYIWLCCSHTFFGINQYIGLLQGNIYVNVMISAASLVPGLILVVFASLHLKRRLALVISFSAAGLSLFVFIFIPSNMYSLSLTFAIIGQTAAFAAFVQIYLYTSEVFPTVIRNSALGFSSVFARLGGFIAPFVVNIGIEWVSISVFCALAIIAASLCYLLPETKGIVLLNTIDETEKSVHK